MGKSSFYVANNMEQTEKHFREICKREGESPSQKICKWMREYVEKHAHGNPQSFFKKASEQLDKPRQTIRVEIPTSPVERRKFILDWITRVVHEYDGVGLHKLVSVFSHRTGLRKQTVMKYVQSLVVNGAIHERLGFLYGREK